MMHKALLAVTFFSLAVSCFAAEPSAPEPAEPPAAPRFAGPGDIYPLWSVVGEWRMTHPEWTGVIHLQPDGMVADSHMKPVAHWSLGSEGGTPLLVLRWDKYGTDSFVMVTPNHFRSQSHPGRFADLRRGE